MSLPILEIKNVSKQYRIGGKRESYKRVDDAIKDLLRPRSKKKDFWALKEINLTVYAGESIGIIGKNGAGKSTLLKVLSRITPPSQGEIITRGRVASLLEVGTGFHMELTGRENIYLNGSILGLKKNEINEQLDAIVTFSGVEQFLETPMKHYSSGMQLRLAFAVAAHLNPEILIIDEVLAVGDHDFQQKCLGKMNEVSQSGRTIIFVSHDLSSLKSLCTRCVLLEKGEIIFSGSTEDVIEKYLHIESKNGSQREWGDDGLGFKEFRLMSAMISDVTGKNCSTFLNSAPITVTLDYKVTEMKVMPRVSLLFLDQEERVLFATCTDKRGLSLHFNEVNKVAVQVPGNIFKAGSYRVAVCADVPNEKMLFPIQNILNFDVENAVPRSQSDISKWGVIEPETNWIVRN